MDRTAFRERHENGGGERGKHAAKGPRLKTNAGCCWILGLATWDALSVELPRCNKYFIRFQLSCYLCIQLISNFLPAFPSLFMAADYLFWPLDVWILHMFLMSTSQLPWTSTLSLYHCDLAWKIDFNNVQPLGLLKNNVHMHFLNITWIRHIAWSWIELYGTASAQLMHWYKLGVGFFLACFMEQAPEFVLHTTQLVFHTPCWGLEVSSLITCSSHSGCSFLLH